MKGCWTARDLNVSHEERDNTPKKGTVCLDGRALA